MQQGLELVSAASDIAKRRRGIVQSVRITLFQRDKDNGKRLVIAHSGGGRQAACRG
jgi:hypothetical protein